MIDIGAGGDTAPRNRNLLGLTGSDIEFPDLKITFKDDRATIIRDRRPEQATIFKFSDRFGRAADRMHPDILRAAAIGHIKNVMAVGAPHRPHLLGVAI